MHNVSVAKKTIAFSLSGFLLLFLFLFGACSSTESKVDSAVGSDAKTNDAGSVDAAPLPPHEPYPHSFVVLNDPPGVSWITSPEDTLSVSGVAGFVSELSYQLEREQGAADGGSLELGHHWQLSGLTLSQGDNRLTIKGKGIDGEDQQDVLTVTHNPGLTMGQVTATPSELNHEGTEPVLVTVEFEGTPTFGSEGVQLFAADDQGVISGAALVTLNDAAQDGDLTAGDGIYSSRVTLDTSNETTHHLRLKIAFEPSGSTAYSARSELFQVVVFPPFTAADAQALDTTMELVETNYASYSQTGDKAAAFAKVAEELKLIPEVADAMVDEEGYSVWWKMKSGITFIYSDFPAGIKGGAGGEDSPGLMSAILLEPFAVEFGKHAQAVETEQTLNEFRCPPVEPVYVVTEKEVTLEECKKLHQYNIVLISSHGSAVGGSTSRGQVTFSLGQEADVSAMKNPDTPLGRDFRAGRLTAGRRKGGGYRYVVTANFVEHYNKPFPPGAIVHLDSCSSAKNFTMARAFLKNGAQAFTGWTHSVGFSYSYEMMRTYYDELKKGRAVPQAVMAAREEHGQADPDNPKTRLVSVLAGSAARLGIECHGHTRLTFTATGSNTGNTVFYSIDKLEPRPLFEEQYFIKEAFKICSYAYDNGIEQRTGSGTLHEVYPSGYDWDQLELRSTIVKIEVDRASDLVKIIPMPQNADPEDDDAWVKYTRTDHQFGTTWKSTSGCDVWGGSQMPYGDVAKTFTGEEVEIGTDFIKGSVPYTSDKGHGTFEFYYDLIPD